MVVFAVEEEENAQIEEKEEKDEAEIKVDRCSMGAEGLGWRGGSEME